MKLVTHKKYSCFDNSDFPAHSIFTFDVYWGNLGTSIFGNSSPAANKTWSRLPSRPSFRFLWICWKRCKLGFWLFMRFGFQYRRTINFLQIQKVWLNYQVYLCGQCSQTSFISLFYQICTSWILHMETIFNTQLQCISLACKPSIGMKSYHYQPMDS